MPHSICLEISQTDNFTEQHALKGKKLQAARPERKKNCKQHALKGQKLLAQGIALGLECDITKSPCKGKSFLYLKLLPLQGDFLAYV